MSSVALGHGLHRNMVHRWLREQRLARQQIQQPTPDGSNRTPYPLAASVQQRGWGYVVLVSGRLR